MRGHAFKIDSSYIPSMREALQTAGGKPTPIIGRIVAFVMRSVPKAKTGVRLNSKEVISELSDDIQVAFWKGMSVSDIYDTLSESGYPGSYQSFRTYFSTMMHVRKFGAYPEHRLQRKDPSPTNRGRTGRPRLEKTTQLFQ